MKRIVLLAFMLAFASYPASAQELQPARMSFLSGTVVVERGDSGDAVSAINAPLFAGDALVTRSGARAEVQIDEAHTLRVGPDTQLAFIQIEPSRDVVRMARGVLAARVSRDTAARFEVQTPALVVRLNVAGEYRVDVRGDGSARVALRAGRADIIVGSRALALVSGDALSVDPAKAGLRLERLGASDLDAFDAWSRERDRSASHAVRERYVGDEIVGAEDLNGYGRWMYADGYGAVWAPYQNVGWAPYTEGRWVREPYYGLTWVSDEPWGWAPYHYGRWFYYSPAVGWAWFPDPLSGPAVWEPALVAFFSFGQGGLAGDVGWVPLAPHEPYGVAMGRYRNVNAPGVFKRRFTLSADEAQRMHVMPAASAARVPPTPRLMAPLRGVPVTPRPRTQPRLRRTS